MDALHETLIGQAVLEKIFEMVDDDGQTPDNACSPGASCSKYRYPNEVVKTSTR